MKPEVSIAAGLGICAILFISTMISVQQGCSSGRGKEIPTGGLMLRHTCVCSTYICVLGHVKNKKPQHTENLVWAKL